MRKILLIIVLNTFVLSVASQESRIRDFCTYWFVNPLLYNNYISDSTFVYYWEDYGYITSEPPILIPDTVVVELVLIRSMSLDFDLDYNKDLLIQKENYSIKTFFQIKYGNNSDCYNLVNSRASQPLEIYNKYLNFSDILQKIEKTRRGGVSLGAIKIPLKELLAKHNIYIFDRPLKVTETEIYAFNQIIITSYFLNEKGEEKCKTEFVFPICGPINDAKTSKWEF